jgi:type II secretory ATPase GspE/PulE/Tfp pilus assembly ATPase PilB-like protein
VIFKFGTKGGSGGRGQDEEEGELIRFQGASNGVPLDVEANQKLVRIAFDPVKELFTDAVTRGAETIRIDPKGERANIGFLIDGISVPAGRIPRQRAHAMTQMTKLLAGLNSAERSQPQAGGIKASLEDSEFELTVLTQPIQGGVERLLIHIRDLDEILDRPEDCGMTDELKSKIREVTGLRQGLFIACGSSRTGVTTTLYACIRGIDAYLRDIQTIGDTQDRELINIVTFETNAEDDLQETLRRCFRVEPDVILLDPIDDANDARIVAEYHDQCTMMTEISAPDAAAGLLKWSEWLENPELAAASLCGVISQKLIRRLCDECKEAYKPNPNLLEKIGFDPEEISVLYRKFRPNAELVEKGEEIEPCLKCNDSGYRGRVAIYELIEMNDAIRKLLASGADLAELRAAARQEDMLTLQKDAMRHVADGTTSLEELQRVFQNA